VRLDAHWGEFDPRISKLSVSNDVLRESLRAPAPPTLGAWLEQRVSAALPTFEGWGIDALDWLSQRSPLQRAAIGMAMGALLGLSLVLCATRVWSTAGARVPVSAPAPQASVLAPAARATLLAARVVPAAAPSPAPALVAVQAQPASEQVPETLESKARSKRVKNKWNRKRAHARFATGTWTFPRPQRRVE
jgi:hypothetical protein